MERVEDGREHDEAEEEDGGLLKSRADATYPCQSPEPLLDLVASLVHLAVVCPRGTPGRERGHHGLESSSPRKRARFAALVRPVHSHRQLLPLASQAVEQLAAGGHIMRLARCQRHRRARLRGNHLDLGGPVPAGLVVGLRPVGRAPSRRDEPARWGCPAPPPPAWSVRAAPFRGIRTPGREPRFSATLLGDLQEGAKHVQVRDAPSASLHQQKQRRAVVLRIGQFHP